MVFEEQAFTRVILDFLRASAKDVEEIQSCWSKMRTCMNNMDETIESYQRERRAEEDMQDRLGTNFRAQYIYLGSGRCGSTFVVPSGCGATIKSRDELLCDKKPKWANVSLKKRKMLARPELRPYPCVEDFPISIDTRPLDRDLYERARRRANKVQLKKVYAFYTEEDTELLWFAQVLEKPRVVVQGDIVCGTRATAANVREESLIVKIRWFERKEDEAGSAYYQPELQDKDWPESYIWLISMRSPNINTLMPFDKMPFSNCVHRVHRDSTNLERQKFRLDVNKIRSCQQLIQRDLAALTSIFS
jgi:hypothetical protein